MKRLSIILILICSASSPAAADEAVSFARDIVPILKTRCVMCHLTGQEPGTMKLAPKAAYATLVGVKAMETKLSRVEPGKPDESYLVRKIEGTHQEAGGSGDRMPVGGAPLAPDQIRKIRAWIQAGALNN